MILMPPPSSIPALKYAKYAHALYSGGAQGGIYDPSDLNTLFQDSAGTVPGAMEQPVGKVLDKSGNGNHLIQATSTARQKLSARVNLQGLNTSTFSDAALLKDGNGLTPIVTPNYSTAPDGKNTAIRLQLNSVDTSGSAYSIVSNLAVTPYQIAGAQYTTKIWMRATSVTAIVGLVGAGSVQTFQSCDTTWRQIVLNEIGVANGAFTLRISSVANAASAGPQDILVWHPSLTLSEQANLPYQWVNSPTDYDTVGFPPYLLSDGADDCYTSASGGGSTTGIFFSGAFTPLLAGSKQVIWSDASGNTGYEICINASNQFEISAGTGAARVTCVSAALTVGTPKVLTAAHDGTTLTVRVDGVATTAACGAASAGTAGTTFLRTNGAASAYAKVRCNGFVQRQGAQPSADMRALVERYMAAIQGRSL